MAAPVQMTANTLNAIKGWPSPSAVDFVAKFDSSVSSVVPPGSCVYVTSTLTYKLGVGTTNRMPLFTFQGSNDPDVANDGGDPSTDKGVWIPIGPSGNVMALVANGAYELISTAFDATQASEMIPNAFLTSPDSGGDAGVITVGTLGTDVIIGTVSRGVTDNGYGTDAVAFWPTFFPVYP